MADIVEDIELIRLLRLRKELKKSNGLAYYRPHAKQSKFHSLADFKYRYVRTGNRFGKSDMGAAEDCAFALGERPWLDKNDPMRFHGIPQRTTKGLIICTDWGKADEIFTSQSEGVDMGKIFKFLPRESVVKVEKNHSGNIDKIIVKSVHGGESTICLDTVAAFKQNDQRSESSDWDWIHVDEPIPKEMWTASARGLIDRNGKAWFTCTPLREPWINDFFSASKRANLDPAIANIIDGTKVVIVGSSYDNPYTSSEGLKEFDKGLTENQRQARIMGMPTDFGGIIYNDFRDENIYVDVPNGWEAMNKPPAYYTIRYALDPHPHTPHAVLFAATAPDGSVWFFDEIFDPCTSTELASQINEKIGPYFCARAICDPSAYLLSPNDKTSMADDLAEHGIYLEKGPKDPSRGITAVKQLLAVKGKVNVSQHLSEFLFEIDRYTWDDKRPNKPRDKDDHMMENFYRLALTGLEYIQLEDSDFNRIVPFAKAY